MRWKYKLQIIEFIILFFGLPVFFYFVDFQFPVAILLPVFLFILIILHRTRSFIWKELIHWSIKKSIVKYQFYVVLLSCFTLLVAVVMFIPKELFNLPLQNTRMWVLLCLMYPMYSVFAQEVIFRTFIYHRYKNIFVKPYMFIIASGVSFSFVHILYYSFVSVFLTLLLGIYLAYIYRKTRSVLFTSILHSVLGNFAFTVGLGQYFFNGLHSLL